MRLFCFGFVLSLVLALSALSPPVQAVVYLNMIPDEVGVGFHLGELYGEGVSFTFNRDYQNGYGEAMGLDPGPPFIIESGIRAVNTYDDDGNVENQGTITFEAGFGLLSSAFDINFSPAEGDGVYLSAASGVNFLGNSFDPINVQGLCNLESGGRGGADPWGTGQHSYTWRNTNFRGSFNAFHPNSSPLKLKGGHATIENCYFSMSDERIAWALVFSDYVSYNSNDDPLWTLVMRNCRFQNYRPLNHLVTLMYIKSVTIEDCHFTDIEPRTVTDRTALVEIRKCGLKSVHNNTAEGNTVSALIGIHCWAAGEARIKTNESLPLVTSNIFIYEDSALSIEPGSRLKFFGYQSGLVAYGQLDIDSAILTSYHDDEYGGDSDHTPQPNTIAAIWNVGNGCGIYVDTTGTATISNSRIRYASGGIVAHNDITIRNCILERFGDKGIALVGARANLFRITNSTIQDITHHSGSSNAAIFFENQSNHGQVVEIDSVTIRGNEMYGVSVGYLGNHPSRVEITNSKIISNEGYGIRFSIYSSLTSMTITNNMIVGNSNTGIYGIDYQSEGVPIRVTGNLVWGNGVAPYVNYDGININSGIPTITNNTIGYNRGRGLYLISSDSLDQASVANNIFYRNHNVGYYDANADDPLFASNVFWENTVHPVNYRHSSGWLQTIAEIQALGGDFASNIESDPVFVPEILGLAGFHRYNDSTKLSTIDVDLALFSDIDVAGRFICPDTTDPRWFQISHMDGDSLLIFGDASEHTTLGRTYRIVDFHLADISPLVDAGRNTSVSSYYDIDGDDRLIDGDEDGTTYVDIGADEYNPDAGYESPIRITSPTAGAFYQEGDSCHIQWETDDVTSLTILYAYDYDPQANLWDTLAKNQDASADGFKWAVPEEISQKCLIRLENASDGSVAAESGLFTIKAYVLARRVINDNLTPYLPDTDAWNFPNDEAHQWPEPWYQQFDYAAGVDPATGQVYSAFFTNWGMINAQSSDFPDWPSFVRAFGEDQCYEGGPGARQYRPSALMRWADIKGDWGGSCFGLGLASSLTFFDSARFVDEYPEIGAFTDLFAVDSSGDIRNLITELWTLQRGKNHMAHKYASVEKTPRDILAELKEVMGENYVNGPMLAIGSRGDHSGGHVVNPYRLRRDGAQPTLFKVGVYDSNFPDDGQNDHYLEIDSAADTWSSPDYPDWNEPGAFCFLMDSSSAYWRTPIMPTGTNRNAPRGVLSFDGLTQVYYSNLTDVVLTDSAGNRSGYRADTVWNDIPGALPQIDFTGGESDPRGYLLPAGPVTIEMSTDSDSLMALSIWDEALTYRYSRRGVDPSQVDLLSYDTALTISNPDSTHKPLLVACLHRSGGIERQYVVSGVTLNGGEVLECYTPDGTTFSMRNRGPGRFLDLMLWSVSPGGGAMVSTEPVMIEAGALGTIVPDWSDPELGEILFMQDFDVDGVYDDTVILNTTTDVEDNEQGSLLPVRFELAQNYPNPFNPVTTINYALPERSHVMIEIINVLGRSVRTLVDREEAAGLHAVTWDGKDAAGNPVATGVYLYRLRAGDYVQTRKMLLLK